MRALGCLTLIVLLIIGLLLLLDVGNVDDDRAGEWIGQKAHRGWNRLRRMGESAKQGWDSSRHNSDQPEDRQ